jgi:hypothetical protein
MKLNYVKMVFLLFLLQGSHPLCIESYFHCAKMLVADGPRRREKCHKNTIFVLEQYTKHSKYCGPLQLREPTAISHKYCGKSHLNG